MCFNCGTSRRRRFNINSLLLSKVQYQLFVVVEGSSINSLLLSKVLDQLFVVVEGSRSTLCCCPPAQRIHAFPVDEEAKRKGGKHVSESPIYSRKFVSFSSTLMMGVGEAVVVVNNWRDKRTSVWFDLSE